MARKMLIDAELSQPNGEEGHYVLTSLSLELEAAGFVLQEYGRVEGRLLLRAKRRCFVGIFFNF